MNASAAGCYGYGGYDAKGGFICGVGFGLGANLYSGTAGFMISTNLLDISVNYSSEGGWTANVMGRQYSRNGVIFDPSFGAGYTYCFVSERSQTPMLPNDDPQSYLMQIETEHPGFEYPDVEVAMPDVEGVARGQGGDYLQYEAKFVNTTRTEGFLTWYNSSGEPVALYSATSGSGTPKYYTITEGTWNATSVNLQPHNKYSRVGVSFRVILGPDRYDPLRGRETGLIRIHPARSMGTEGCIGLISNEPNLLLNFQNRIVNYINKYHTIPVHVIYSK